LYRFEEMNRAVAFLLTIPVFFILESCLKQENFPDEPVLRFKSIETRPDSAVITLEFTDGDGNFGLEQGDTTGIFADCIGRYNLYCEYYEQQEGEWIHFPVNPCEDPNAVPFYYRVPYARPTGQIQSQKGEIRLVITPFYYFPGEYDTCRFEIRAADRDQNPSNTVITRFFLKGD
jgi:hypothetical protein